MSKIIAAVVIVVVAVLAFWFLRDRGGEVANSPTVSPTETVSPTVSPSPTATATVSPTASPSPAAVSTVTYTDSGYSPKTLTVKAGTVVTFRNQSSRLMWNASAPHPAHNAYPMMGGCIASAFDQCVSAPNGQNWSFKFDQKGSWNFHNHLFSSHFGTVVVQ